MVDLSIILKETTSIIPTTNHDCDLFKQQYEQLWQGRMQD